MKSDTVANEDADGISELLFAAVFFLIQVKDEKT